jgi:5-methylcytosine-specific restriction endonuclease McrA
VRRRSSCGVSRPKTDDYPEHLERVVAALASGDVEAARAALEPIAYPRRDVPRRTMPSAAIVASIYRRDRFQCRYCGCRVIPSPIMRLLSQFFPESFPYHQNWKGGATHPAVASRSPSLDHVVPWAGGGDNDPGNLVCACWVCNSVKGDLTLEQLGWELLPISDDAGWDGLTRYYAALWRLADEPPGHATWVRLFS